jgi:hypothetical protein
MHKKLKSENQERQRTNNGQKCECNTFHISAERYQPAMRLAGATRAKARGVTDGRIGSDGWFGEVFIQYSV